MLGKKLGYNVTDFLDIQYGGRPDATSVRKCKRSKIKIEYVVS